ncbi:hypothetical protein JOM56_011499 [Amanita muscaria]
MTKMPTAAVLNCLYYLGALHDTAHSNLEPAQPHTALKQKSWPSHRHWKSFLHAHQTQPPSMYLDSQSLNQHSMSSSTQNCDFALNEGECWFSSSYDYRHSPCKPSLLLKIHYPLPPLTLSPSSHPIDNSGVSQTSPTEQANIQDGPYGLSYKERWVNKRSNHNHYQFL